MSVYFLIIAGLAGIYMAFNIGANDSANSLASAVGAKAITFKQAVIIGGVLEFLGAYFVGSHVSETVKKGVIEYSSFPNPHIFAFALFSALVGASLWVFIATWKGLPVSTTHSIIGALVGVGLISFGIHTINWKRVLQIVLSWITSPFFSAFLAFFLFKIINKNFIAAENRRRRLKKYFPVFIFLTFFIVSLSFLFKTPLGKKLSLSILGVFLYSFFISSVLTFLFSFVLIKKVKIFEAEEIFRILQIFTSCYVAFAHGSNDVANAVGPMAGIYNIYKTQTFIAKAPVPGFLLAIGGIGISLGIFILGYRVIKTVGINITELTNTRGFSVDFATATTVLLCSKLGIPVSTTHAAVGAVIGVGFARGVEALDFRVIKNILYAWVLTLPVAGIIAGIVFVLIR